MALLRISLLLTAQFMSAAMLIQEMENVALPNVTEFVQSRLQSYDKYHMPPWSKGKPVNLQLGFYIESLSEIEETAMTFRVDMYLRLRWSDSRLAHDGPYYILFNEPSIISKLWLPDIYIANAQKSRFHEVTQPNRLLRILPNGDVQYSVRIAATLSCNLRLHNYPIDYQECFIRLLSYGYSEKFLNVSWLATTPTEVNPLIALPEMRLNEIKPEYCNGTYVFNNSTHIYSCLKATISVERQIGYHMLQTYIPSGLMVVVSWASFWIDPAAVPARTGLCITTLLTITTQAAGVRASLPPVSYAKAIDYWIGICTFMIFGTLVEYVIVNSVMRRPSLMSLDQKFARCLSKSSKIEDAYSMEFERDRRVKEDFKKLSKMYLKMAHMIDRLSKFIFPALFFLFNIIYWLHFLK